MSETVRRNQVEYNISSNFLENLQEKANSDGILDQEEIEILRQNASEEELEFLNSFSNSQINCVSFSIITHETEPSSFEFNIETNPFNTIIELVNSLVQSEQNISVGELEIILNAIREYPESIPQQYLIDISGIIIENSNRNDEFTVMSFNRLLENYSIENRDNTNLQLIRDLLEIVPPRDPINLTERNLRRLENTINHSDLFEDILEDSTFSIEDINRIVISLRENENEDTANEFINTLRNAINSARDDDLGHFKNLVIDYAVEYNIIFHENSRPSMDRSIKFNPFADTDDVEDEEEEYQEWLDEPVRLREDTFRQIRFGLSISIGVQLNETEGDLNSNTNIISNGVTNTGNSSIETDSNSEIFTSALSNLTRTTYGYGGSVGFNYDNDSIFLEVPRRVSIQIIEAIEEGNLEEAREILDMFLPQVNPE